MKVKAIDLQPGDECIGPVIFADRGIVHSTTVIGESVQVAWRGPHPHYPVKDTVTVRPANYFFEVRHLVRNDGPLSGPLSERSVADDVTPEDSIRLDQS